MQTSLILTLFFQYIHKSENLLNMEALEISDKTIFLEGLSLKSQFQLRNKHDKLAITYLINPYISCKQKDKPKDSFLMIFPNQGIILPEQTQKISVKIKKSTDLEATEVMYDECAMRIQIRSHFDNQFNRIKIRDDLFKDNLQRIPQINSDIFQQDIDVEIASNYYQLLNEIFSEIAVSNTLGKDASDISVIQGNSKILNNIDEERDLSFMLEKLSINSKQTAPKNNSNIINNQYDTKVKKDIEMYSVKSDLSAFSNPECKSSLESNFLKQNMSAAYNSSKFRDIFILTIISALFFCFGSNIKNFLNF